MPANRRVGSPSFFMLKLSLATTMSGNKPIKVTKNRQKAIFTAFPYVDKILPEGQLSPQMNILMIIPIKSRLSFFVV